jgi:uncharacterized membrane protein
MSTGHRAANTARVALLDALRLLATVQMVQGHTVDAVLSPEYRHGTAYGVWLALRGLTSVAFLFIAGLAYHLATLRDLTRHLRDRTAVVRRFRRAGTLIALGYALHLPVQVLWRPDTGGAAALAASLLVDVLHCIGVSLAVMETLALVLRNRRAVEFACCALGLGSLAAAPVFARMPADGPWLPLLQYVTPQGGSLFPLFPWAAHVLLGAAFGGVLLGEVGGARRTLRLLALSIAVHAASALTAPFVDRLITDHLTRLGWVLALGAVLAVFEPAVARWPAWTRRLSSETLFIYVFHVLLVYGQGVGLSTWMGERLAPLPSALLAAAVLGLSAGCALSYQRTLGGLARGAATG